MINCVFKDHRDKIKVPDPVVKDLISKKIVKQIIEKKSKADFTVREVYFPIFRKARPFFFRVCLRLTLWLYFLFFILDDRSRIYMHYHKGLGAIKFTYESI